MEIRINRKAFLDAVSFGSVFAGHSKTMAMLDNVKIRIEGSLNRMVIWSTDGDCFIEHAITGVGASIDASVIEFCVNPVEVVKSLKLLKDVDLVIDIREGVSMVIRHKSGDMEFPIMGVMEFPIIEKAGGDKSYELDSERLFGWVNSAKSFASTDTLRPIMCGMYLCIRDGECVMCATDTRVLITDKAHSDALVGIVGDISAVIPNSIFGALLDVLNGTDKVRIRVGERNIAFKTDNALLTCKRMGGNYPRFEAVIPQSNDIECVIDKATIADSVMRSLVFADKAQSCLKMDISGMNLSLVGEDLNCGKRAQEGCICDHTGNDIRIWVQGELFLRCLNSVHSDEVRLTFSAPNKAVLIYDKDCADKRIIIMPMQIN